MIHPTFAEVKRLAGRGNLIPIWRELPADLDTPVSIYLKLRSTSLSHEAFLLESVEGGEQLARYSFIGTEPSRLMTIRGNALHIRQRGQPETITAPSNNPLDALRALMCDYQAVRENGLPRFTGGLVGYLAYDLARYFEQIPTTAEDELQVPDALLMLADSLVAFDHVKHRLLVIAHAHVNGDLARAYGDAVARVEQLSERLHGAITADPSAGFIPAPPAHDVRGTGHGQAGRRMTDAQSSPTVHRPLSRLRSNMTPEQYQAKVRVAKEYIAAGDAFQIVLAQRFECETSAAPFDIYRTLRRLNPSPYMFYLDFGDLQLIGASPEMMVRLEDGIAEVRPIAGTRRRGKDDAEDECLARDLLSDPKERAEHVMLVDLGRNDLGRVAHFGSVCVSDLMSIEKFSHVMHITSRVRAELRPEFDAFDLFRATFPAGTLSGAPKIRAMQIIEELEGTRRGAYGGAVGYFDYAGNLDTCITIRTILMRSQRAYIQAGAGIVADSDPASEHQECVNKAQALAEAIRLTEETL